MSRRRDDLLSKKHFAAKRAMATLGGAVILTIGSPCKIDYLGVITVDRMLCYKNAITSRAMAALTESGVQAVTNHGIIYNLGMSCRGDNLCGNNDVTANRAMTTRGKSRGLAARSNGSIGNLVVRAYYRNLRNKNRTTGRAMATLAESMAGAIAENRGIDNNGMSRCGDNLAFLALNGLIT